MSDTVIPARPPSTRRFVSRRALSLGAAVVGLVAAGACGLHWWTSGRFMVETDDAYVRADTVTISPRVGGSIVAVDVADNQQVRAYCRDRSRGNATAERDRPRQGHHHVARRGRSFHRSRVSPATVLAREEVGSDQTLEAAAAAAQRSRAGAAEARAGLAAARALLPVLATRRQAAMADLDKALGMLRQARAARDAAQLDLARTVIRAPVDGQIGQRAARVGQYADIGTPLMAVVPMLT